MKKSNLFNTINGVRSLVKKRSPEILTGIGIVGMITTTVMAVRATPKALSLIDEKKTELRVDSLSKKEVVLTTWRCYVPSVIVGSASAFCLAGASATNLRRNAALATAYAISESTLNEYRDRVVESIGHKKEKAMRESMAEDKLVKNPVRDVILTEKGGNTICFDAISGRYFKSDRDAINRAVNELNRQMRDDMYVTLNEFYYELGLDGIKLGDDLGWNIEKGYIELDFSSHLDSNGTPCLVIDYQIAPVYDYR